MAFQIAHIHNPDAVHTVIIGHAHLFPDLGERNCVHPAVGFGPTDIVKVVVHPVPAGAASLRFAGQHANVAEIVVGEKNRYVVRDVDPVLPELLHFFVQSENLWDFHRIFARNIGENLPLVGNNPLHHRHPFFERPGVHHRFVAVAAHADGDQLLIVLAHPDPVPPEQDQVFPVLAVIPLTGAVLAPFVPTPHHRLMMGSAHDNPVLVGQFAVE